MISNPLDGVKLLFFKNFFFFFFNNVFTNYFSQRIFFTAGPELIVSLSRVGGNLWLRARCCWDALMLICCSRGALLCTHTCCAAHRAREAVGVVVDSLLFVVAHAADVFLCEALYFTVEPWVLMISPVWLGAPPRQTADCRRLPRCLYSGGR